MYHFSTPITFTLIHVLTSYKLFQIQPDALFCILMMYITTVLVNYGPFVEHQHIIVKKVTSGIQLF